MSTPGTPSPSSPITPNCTFRNSISLFYHHSFINFRNSFTSNTCKADSLTSFHFLLKTLLCCTDLWNLDNGLATAPWKPHFPSEAMPPISHLPVSVCHLPLIYSQILAAWKNERFSFCVCSITHCTMKSWTFIWVSKCRGDVPRQSLTLGLDSVFHKTSATASRSSCSYPHSFRNSHQALLSWVPSTSMFLSFDASPAFLFPSQ